MKTIKPNKLSQLQTQLKKVPKELFPSEIREDEKDYYHLINIEKSVDFSVDEVKYNVTVKKYNEMSYKNIKDTLRQLGYVNMHILHDPTIKEVKAEKQAKEKQ